MTSSPQKVAYLLDDFAHPHAGTEGQLVELIRQLDRRRYEPAVTLLRPSEHIERHGFVCPVSVLGIPRLASPLAVVAMLRFAFRLRRDRCRLVHCYFNDVSIIAPPMLKLAGIRVVVSRRDTGFWHTPARLFCLRRVQPFVDRYVCNSAAVKQTVMLCERARADKISVIYNGHAPRCGDEPVASALAGIPHGTPVVGIVANLRPIKRVDTLILAFALVVRRVPNARLVIVGDDRAGSAGALRSDLERLAAELGVTDRVMFAGPSDEPERYIRRFDVAVLCSASEGFANAIIEYMRCARPVVCTDTGGNAELVVDGRNGFLVPVGDSAALADRILRLLVDRSLAERLASAGARTVSELTAERMAAEHMSCYDEVLRGAAAAGVRAQVARHRTAGHASWRR